MAPVSKEPAGRLGHLAELAKHELRRFVALFLYLWAMFVLFDLHEYLVLAAYRIPYEKWGLGLINALVLAKVMVVADEVRFQSPLARRPLIVSVIARSVAFALLFIFVDVAEKALIGAFHGKSIAQSIPTYGSGGLLSRVIVAIILAVGLMPFFAFEAIDGALGRGRLAELLLKRRARAPSEPPP